MSPATISGFGHAYPPSVRQQDMWDGFFAEHFSQSAIARRLFRNVDVEQRHAVVNPLVEDATTWSTKRRMQRYLPEALPLATRAVEDALQQAGVDACNVGMVAVVSCTGYVSPGLDTYLVEEVGLSPHVQRLSIGHMGCYAALPGLAAVSDYVASQGKPAVLVSVELTSLHAQPPTDDVEQMVAHALFSDAASAVVLQPEAAGFRVVDVASAMSIEHAPLMTWDVTDLGFRMGLSSKIPEVVETQVEALVDRLLAPHDLTKDHVRGWAVHPGGPKVLDVVARALKLDDDCLSESRSVLAQHGNCSSATVLMVLDEIRSQRELHRGDYAVAMAFGPGLTLYAVLLRVE